jgi:hypothetical protein
MTSVYFTFRGKQHGRNHKRLIEVGRAFGVTPAVERWHPIVGNHSGESNRSRVALPTRRDAEQFNAAVPAAGLFARSMTSRRQHEGPTRIEATERRSPREQGGARA